MSKASVSKIDTSESATSKGGAMSATTPATTPAATANWVDICALDDLPYEAGIGALLPIDGREEQIALFRLEDSAQVYATANLDPFSHANVLARGIIGSIGDEIVVASPILKQHFSLATGQCIEYPDVRIAVYPVQVVDGRVLVADQALAPAKLPVAP